MKSIFIGTLLNGESEFFEHSNAIKSQDKGSFTLRQKRDKFALGLLVL